MGQGEVKGFTERVVTAWLCPGLAVSRLEPGGIFLLNHKWM